VGSHEAAPSSLVEHYEELRHRALHGECDGWRLGLAVLQRRGVAAWIHAWVDLAPAPARRASSPAPGQCNELVAVLASMAIGVAGG
jgi:hypothetical protein